MYCLCTDMPKKYINKKRSKLITVNINNENLRTIISKRYVNNGYINIYMEGSEFLTEDLRTIMPKRDTLIIVMSIYINMDPGCYLLMMKMGELS